MWVGVWTPAASQPSSPLTSRGMAPCSSKSNSAPETLAVTNRKAWMSWHEEKWEPRGSASDEIIC